MPHAVFPKALKNASLGSDATIGARECFNMTREGFGAANPDHDGSLSAGEFETRANERLP